MRSQYYIYRVGRVDSWTLLKKLRPGFQSLSIRRMTLQYSALSGVLPLCSGVEWWSRTMLRSFRQVWSDTETHYIRRWELIRGAHSHLKMHSTTRLLLVVKNNHMLIWLRRKFPDLGLTTRSNSPIYVSLAVVRLCTTIPRVKLCNSL